MKRKLKARIVSKEGLGQGYFCLDLLAPHLARESKPCQFVMVTTSDTFDPLLPRPFSIMDVMDDTITLLVKRVGKGSTLLTELFSGAEVTVTGPLGSWFPEVKSVILVAGGYGIAPFYFLTSHGGEDLSCELFYGGKSASDILFLSRFEKRIGRGACHITTEDGSIGKKGIVTDLLSPILERGNRSIDAIFACGPTGLLRTVHHAAEKVGITAYVSMESVMGCGYGVCLGCVVPTTRGLVRVCKEGPVFDSRTILWEEI